jgi:hypothetical protein
VFSVSGASNVSDKLDGERSSAMHNPKLSFINQEAWEAWLAWGLAQAAAHQHQEAHGVERPQLPHRQQGHQTLMGLGIAREITGGRRNRLFGYDVYLAILSEGTEPL